MRHPRTLALLALAIGCFFIQACSVKPRDKAKKRKASAPPIEYLEEPASAKATARRPITAEQEPQEEPPMTNPRILQADGTKIVDHKGRPVRLRGCNFGNWLLLEMWMLDIHDVRDQHEFEGILESRFGTREKERLMSLYRANWIKERDFKVIRKFGMNTVRIPFHYSILEDDAHPYKLKPDAFKWLDWAVEMAEKYDLYVILDLHGVQGGQSDDHTTGRAGQNKLWDSEANQKRIAWLWGQIADHYKDSATVAAYDVINEPFGAQSEERRKILVQIFDRIYKSIRAVDSNHIIFAPATYAGFEFYGNPADRGWENAGFTHHYYPGLFGEDPLRETHALFISRTIPPVKEHLRDVQAPFLVGEFNVVFNRVGGAALMRHYFDLYNDMGWAATMWCYKLLHHNGGMGLDTWSMVCNRKPQPLASIRTQSAKEIEGFFKWFGTMEYDYFENLGAALEMEQAPPITLPEAENQMFEPAATNDPAPWQAADINRALPGGQRVMGTTAMTIYGGGKDIWSDVDQFRFLWQQVRGEFELSTTIRSIADTDVYAKAGLMIRRSLDPDSAAMLFHVFPSGELLIGMRSKDGTHLEQKSLGAATFPIGLRIRRKGDALEVAFTPPGQEEVIRKIRIPPPLRNDVYVGFAVLSHDNRCLTTAEFDEIEFRSSAGRLQ